MQIRSASMRCRAPSVAQRRCNVVAVPARQRTLLQAKKSEGDAEQKKRFEELVAKQLEALKASGMSQAQARQTLKTWADAGAKTEDELRQLLVQRSMKPVSTLAAQLALDFTCSAGGFIIGSGLGSASFPGAIALQILAYFGGCWYAIQALGEAGALGAVIVAARRYSTDSDAILAAVQQIAGPVGASPVDSARLAVSTLKVVSVLQSMADDLKALTGDGRLEPSTLRNLSAILTLQAAKEKFGWDAAQYGLTDAQAADIAAVFAEFDANADGRLEASELRRLCDLVGRRLSDGELKEAVRLLGSRDAGYVYFNDFAEWYLGLKPAQPTSASTTTE